MAAAGTPRDALTPFAQALTKPPAAGDPDVSRAFVLGWHMAERLQPAAPAAAAGDHALGMSALGAEERKAISAKQIQADVALLADAIKKAKLVPPALEPLPDGDDLHLALLGTLTAADYRLGKAYCLGLALAETCGRPGDMASLHAMLEPTRIAKLLGWLDELSTALPAHAAGSVSRSLELWRDHTPHGPETLRVMRRQGELWRALISGEKRGVEMLDAESYLVAARGFASKARRLAFGALLRFPVLTLLVLALFALGIYLLIRHSSDPLAGATTLLAALGITWKGLGGAVGKVVAGVEQPLWGAQLDIAIAEAVTMLPDTPDPWHRLAVAKAIKR